MSDAKESEIQRITRQSRDILNKNGYSFQNSVISKLIKTLENWKFYGAEIPVSTRGRNTHRPSLSRRFRFLLLDWRM